MKFAFLMTFFMGTCLTLLLSRIFALAAVCIAAAQDNREPARKSVMGQTACWLLGITITGGCFFYYSYGNGIIFSEPAKVCTGRTNEGATPYQDSKLYPKTGKFLVWYSLAV